MAPERQGSQLARCYRLVAALLSGQQLDRRAIARLLGVREAAADAHIKELEAAEILGLRLERKGNGKTVRWRGDAPTLTATRPLAVAACFGASVAQLFHGTSYATLLDQAREDVIGRLKKRGDFDDARRKFLFISQAGEVALPDRQGLLDDVIDAVLRQQLVELEYTGFDGAERTEKIAPWSVAIYDHQLYVLAGDSEATPRPYRLSRIRSLRVLATTFAYPTRAAYDPERLFRDTFGIFIRGESGVEEVLLRFAPRWRTYARTHLWHSTHQVVSEEEGVVVRLRVRICRELEAFILSFGGEVEVLSPPALRESIVAQVTALTSVYAPVRVRPQRRERARPQSMVEPDRKARPRKRNTAGKPSVAAPKSPSSRRAR